MLDPRILGLAQMIHQHILGLGGYQPTSAPAQPVQRRRPPIGGPLPPAMLPPTTVPAPGASGPLPPDVVPSQNLVPPPTFLPPGQRAPGGVRPPSPYGPLPAQRSF